MITIGITGGVGAGKSTVLDFLEKEYGACIIQADQVGHEVMMPGGICYDEVVKLFGDAVIKNDKTIDRRMVADVVFSDEEKLQALNGIIHPAVRTYILNRLESENKKGTRLAAVEAALLLEERYQEFCNEVWYIRVPEDMRIARLMESRGYSSEKAESIIRKQKSDEYFMTHTDAAVDNSGSTEDTYLQIKERLKNYETL